MATEGIADFRLPIADLQEVVEVVTFANSSNTKHQRSKI
jgi:hypothetical protein